MKRALLAGGIVLLAAGWVVARTQPEAPQSVSRQVRAAELLLTHPIPPWTSRGSSMRRSAPELRLTSWCVSTRFRVDLGLSDPDNGLRWQ